MSSREDESSGRSPIGREARTELLASDELVMLLASDELILTPGAYDALGACLVEAAGFSAVYMTGYGMATRSLALPDAGITTMSEVVQQARRLTSATRLPVIADADDGFGQLDNVRRTIYELESTGVAAIQIEDRVAADRGNRLFTIREMAERVGAAVTTRLSALVVARTDAVPQEGLDEAIKRALAYDAAGADILFVNHLAHTTDIKKCGDALAGKLLLFNWTAVDRATGITRRLLAECGFRLIIYPTRTFIAGGVAEYAALQCLNLEDFYVTAEHEEFSRLADEVANKAFIRASRLTL